MMYTITAETQRDEIYFHIVLSIEKGEKKCMELSEKGTFKNIILWKDLIGGERLITLCETKSVSKFIHDHEMIYK